MADLIATAPLDAAPLDKGGVTLALVDPGPVTCLALYPGASADIWLSPLDLPFPAPNRVSAAGDLRLVWTGRDQAHLVGAVPPPGGEGAAAITDQSDGWVCLSLTGAEAGAVLARLVALDLREAAFPPGTAARSALNHMPLILWRESDGFRLMTFRSMARTAWHELAEAMARVAARAALPR
ncbi:MAG: sarcosine oxidase subunit gamma [Paracoccaceae bacterium]|nr:MAG: sarcosine oxidase subunit gamma [Paracoccaceae bacterium]